MSSAIQSLVEQFVAQLETAVRREALEAVRTALQESSPSKPNRSGRPAKPDSAPSGTRRAPEQIEATAKQIAAYVAKNPGKRTEDIKKALRIPAPEWTKPVEKLLESKRVKTKGQKRATTYFAG